MRGWLEEGKCCGEFLWCHYFAQLNGAPFLLYSWWMKVLKSQLHVKFIWALQIPRHILGNTHPGEQDQPQAFRTRSSFSWEILGLASYRASRESETSKDYGLWTMAVSVARFELMAKAHLNQSPPSSSRHWLNLVSSMKILMWKIEVEEWLRGRLSKYWGYSSFLWYFTWRKGELKSGRRRETRRKLIWDKNYVVGGKESVLSDLKREKRKKTKTNLVRYEI